MVSKCVTCIQIASTTSNYHLFVINGFRFMRCCRTTAGDCSRCLARNLWVAWSCDKQQGIENVWVERFWNWRASSTAEDVGNSSNCSASYEYLPGCRSRSELQGKENPSTPQYTCWLKMVIYVDIIWIYMIHQDLLNQMWDASSLFGRGVLQRCNDYKTKGQNMDKYGKVMTSAFDAGWSIRPHHCGCPSVLRIAVPEGVGKLRLWTSRRLSASWQAAAPELHEKTSGALSHL